MEEAFKKYVEAQYSGLYNMITDAKSVMEEFEIDPEDYKFIINNYNELKEKYPKAYEEGKVEGIEYREFFIWD